MEKIKLTPEQIERRQAEARLLRRLEHLGSAWPKNNPKDRDRMTREEIQDLS
jgi:hypothetical protein